MIKYLDLKSVTALHGDEIRQAVCDVVDGGWYLQGEATKRFEEHYAEYIGVRHAVGCGNGLDALTLILRAYVEMGVMRKGDEVIVPANTYIATILAITENGLRPVLVDASLDTLQIDDSRIEAAITPRTRALMIVHLYGRCAYTERIGEICRRYSLKLIEDNAQAHGCRYHGASGAGALDGRRTGSLGDAAAHSFYPGKNLGALGDAGAVTTDDDELALMVRQLGNYGSSRKYVFDHVGRNSRIDEVQAAVLDVKLRYLDADNARRKEVARLLIHHLHNAEVLAPSMDFFDNSVFHIFPVLAARRDELQQYLLQNGVQTMIHYPIPPHQQQCYAAAVADGSMRLNGSLPVTKVIHARELSLPCNQVMTDDDALRVAELVSNFPKQK